MKASDQAIAVTVRPFLRKLGAALRRDTPAFTRAEEHPADPGDAPIETRQEP